MNKIINTISIFLLLANFSVAQEVNCERKAYFGETEICLPKIEGYQECYSDSIVNKLANRTEVPANMVLGFYLDNKTFKKKDSLGLFSFDNYFKVYGTKQIKDYKANSKLLKKMQEMLTGNFISINWESIEKEVDKLGLEVKIGVPTVIESYNLNDSSFTFVLLTKYELEGGNPYIMAMTINGLLINERLIWMAYYLNYNGEVTIPILRKKSNKILTKLLNAKK